MSEDKILYDIFVFFLKQIKTAFMLCLTRCLLSIFDWRLLYVEYIVTDFNVF